MQFRSTQPYRSGGEYCAFRLFPAFVLAVFGEVTDDARLGRRDLILVRANRRSPESADRFVAVPKADEDANSRS